MKPSEPLDESPEFFNESSGDMNIGVQAAVVHNVAVNHGVGRQTPAQKVEEGIRCLRGGQPREAEGLIGGAILEGYEEPRAAYYWALAILGGRTRDQLEEVHLTNLDHACAAVAHASDDVWKRGLQVIRGLVDLSRAAENRDTASAMGQDREGILDDYNELDPERSMEIRRYLDLVLDGVLLDRVYQQHAMEAERERLSAQRVERAWKFFEPDPVPPEYIPPPQRPSRLGAWSKLVAAMVLTIVASFPLLPVLAQAGASAVGGLLLLSIGLIGTIRYGLGRRIVLDERDDERERTEPPTEGDRLWKPEKNGWEFFLDRVVRGAFNRSAPADREEAMRWQRATKWYRSNLTREIAENYFAPELHAKPSKIRWLARWHAENLRERWNGSDLDTAPVTPVPSRTYLGIVVAAIAAVTGAALSWWSLWTYGAIADIAILPVLVGVGLRVACDQGCWLARTATAHSRATSAAMERHQAEMAVYHGWKETLADRPRSWEMASWLDYDKRSLRARAMELYRITNPEVIAHVAFIEPLPKSKSARELGQPTWYDAYLVRVVLLTRGGVRLAEFPLNMTTADIGEPRRRSFRYDAIGSVHVSIERTKRSPVGQGTGDEGGGYRSTFRIVLLNREEPIECVVEVLDEEVDDRNEEAHELVERALDSSGVSGALRMMEAITADGKEWVQTHENRGRRRRLYRSPRHTETGESPNGKAARGTEGVTGAPTSE